MTHSEFNRLYDDGCLSLKIYEGIVGEEKRTVEAFEWNGHYFLRIHKVLHYVTNRRSNGKRYKMSNESHFIKEFGTKETANRYFSKVSDGMLKRVM